MEDSIGTGWFRINQPYWICAIHPRSPRK